MCSYVCDYIIEMADGETHSTNLNTVSQGDRKMLNFPGIFTISASNQCVLKGDLEADESTVKIFFGWC